MKDNNKKDISVEVSTILQELSKCKFDPYYFYKMYVMVEGKEPTISRDQWDLIIASFDVKRIQRR